MSDACNQTESVKIATRNEACSQTEYKNAVSKVKPVSSGLVRSKTNIYAIDCDICIGRASKQTKLSITQMSNTSLAPKLSQIIRTTTDTLTIDAYSQTAAIQAPQLSEHKSTHSSIRHKFIGLRHITN